MTTIFLALLPVFIVILIGFGLRHFRVIGDSHWAGLDQLCYFVLFPAIIFKEIAAADFTGVPVFRMAGAMMLAVIVMIGLLVLLHRPLMKSLGMNGPQFTSLVQGAARWHTFIAFAIIPLQFGPQALSLGAVSAAAMTPAASIACKADSPSSYPRATALSTSTRAERIKHSTNRSVKLLLVASVPSLAARKPTDGRELRATVL